GEINLVKFLIYDDENNTKLGEIANHDKYSYKLETSKWNDNAEAYVDALVADDGNSYKVSVDNGLIDGKTSHSINAVYTYTNISRRFKDGAWTIDSSNDANWVLTAAQEPTVIYCSWSKQSNDFTRFAFHSGKYNNGNQNNPDWKYRTANQIQWAASYTAGSEVALTGALDLSTVKVKYGLKAQVAGISYTTLKDLITYGYLKLIDAYTSANGVKNAYIKPVVKDDGSFDGFNQVAEKTIDHNETLVLKVVDCFNYKQTIELPIQIVSAANNNMEGYTDTTWD
ncbi:MAG: hypothetical protein PUB87_04430, partial [Eubacteriaceae bacterium]|nr:hypothetical protein [Eubacteriaceae bacterium]